MRTALKGYTAKLLCQGNMWRWKGQAAPWKQLHRILSSAHQSFSFPLWGFIHLLLPHSPACASCQRPASCPAALGGGQGCGHQLALAGLAAQTKAHNGENNGLKDWIGSSPFQLSLLGSHSVHPCSAAGLGGKPPCTTHQCAHLHGNHQWQNQSPPI